MIHVNVLGAVHLPFESVAQIALRSVAIVVLEGQWTGRRDVVLAAALGRITIRLKQSIQLGGRRQRQLRRTQSSDSRFEIFKMSCEFAAQQVDNRHPPVRLNAVAINTGDDAREIRDTKVIDFARRVRRSSPPSQD